MLDIYARETAGQCALLVRGAEFFRIELAPLADGQILASLTATTVDEEEPNSSIKKSRATVSPRSTTCSRSSNACARRTGPRSRQPPASQLGRQP